MTFDWRVAIVGLQVFSIFVTAFGFAVIKFNDFKHLHNSFEKLEKSFEDLTIKVTNHGEKIASMDARCDGRHNDNLKKR